MKLVYASDDYRYVSFADGLVEAVIRVDGAVWSVQGPDRLRFYDMVCTWSRHASMDALFDELFAVCEYPDDVSPLERIGGVGYGPKQF